jgi:hypothetical protein
MLICGHRHLHTVLSEYLAHYNGHRPHRALGQRCPDGHRRSQVLEADSGSRIMRYDVVGGLVHEYRRAA